MLAALFVETNGCYWDLPGVDPWDIIRDARLYPGPFPVVAHPLTSSSSNPFCPFSPMEGCMSKTKSAPASEQDFQPKTALGRYRIEYFSSLDWKDFDYEVVGESEAQVRVWVDKECPRSYRDKPYSSDKPRPDTLKIERIGDVTLPFIINE